MKQKNEHDKLWFSHFPLDIQTVILGYLSVNCIDSTLLSSQSIFKEEGSSQRLSFSLTEATQEFSKLIAVEGEENQSKAEHFLSHIESPELLSQMIVGRVPIQDASKRDFITPISAYGYAYWSGDTRMLRMLEQYMNDEMKTKALTECTDITEKGVTFTFQGEQITASKYFDFQPLIDAYQAIIAEADPLIEAYIWDDHAWGHAYKLWLNVGKEQTKVPIHVAQEYCSMKKDKLGRSVRKDLSLERTAKFHNINTDSYIPWEFAGTATHLGISHVVTMSAVVLHYKVRTPSVWHNDLALVVDLARARAEERSQTLKTLSSVEHAGNYNY